MIARAMRRLFSLLLALFALPAFGHAVHHHIGERLDRAIVIALTYSNGKPFADERYRLYADGAANPTLSGRTDSAGRIVFLPGDAKRWRLATHARHGHGVALEFATPAAPSPPSLPAAPAPTGPTDASPPAAASGPSRASLALFGFSLIFGGFGLYQLWGTRRGR